MSDGILRSWHAVGNEVLDHHNDQVVECIYGVSYEQDEANARFIAAAPDLLEALEKMVSTFPMGTCCGRCGETISAAEAAIAKAKGEA